MTVTDDIKQRLAQIAYAKNITLLLACESGSRAWGFASRDSDYDVRFVYCHPQAWYLQVFEQRDVIDPAVDGLFDLGGWELRKALRLLWRGNSALQEWLSSPIIYRADESALAQLRELAEYAFLPKSACHHYLALGRRYLDRVIAEPPTGKRYLYALRALLCVRWIIEHRRQPPMRFDELLAALALPEQIATPISRLLIEKAQSKEGDTTARLSVLEDFMRQLVETSEARIPDNPNDLDPARFDQVFQAILAQQGQYHA